MAAVRNVYIAFSFVKFTGNGMGGTVITNILFFVTLDEINT